jgi:hypothetical protein
MNTPIRTLSRPLLAVAACLAGIAGAYGQQREAPPPGGLPALLMQQAGSDPLAKKAALRWTMIDHWASMDDFGGTGPFPAEYSAAPGDLPWVVYAPRDVKGAAERRKLGVYIWGNGGCSGDSVREARFHLTEIATHGYVVLAPGRLLSGPRAPKLTSEEREKLATAPENRATAPRMLQALDWILAENERAGSPYQGKIDPERVAVAGNSCGGLIAMKAALDPRVRALLITNSGIFITPRPGVDPVITKDDLSRLHTPVLYIVGGPQDTAQPNALDDFQRINHVPIFLADQPGAGHIGLFMEPRGEGTKIELDWLKWQFDRDRVAARTFTGKDCTLCTDLRWQVHRKRIR